MSMNKVQVAILGCTLQKAGGARLTLRIDMEASCDEDMREQFLAKILDCELQVGAGRDDGDGQAKLDCVVDDITSFRLKVRAAGFRVQQGTYGTALAFDPETVDLNTFRTILGQDATLLIYSIADDPDLVEAVDDSEEDESAENDDAEGDDDDDADLDDDGIDKACPPLKVVAQRT